MRFRPPFWGEKMKVKNVSARLHHVGNVSIAPGEEKEIPKEFEGAINKADLVAVEAPKTEKPPKVEKAKPEILTEE